LISLVVLVLIFNIISIDLQRIPLSLFEEINYSQARFRITFLNSALLWLESACDVTSSFCDFQKEDCRQEFVLEKFTLYSRTLKGDFQVNQSVQEK
jgi:hypothetical protein